MAKIYFSWQEFDEAVEQIVIELGIRELLGSFDAIHGVPRGGLVLAVALSHALDKPIKLELDWNDRILVVDDISDTGKTLDKIRPKLCATIHYVSGALVEPTIWLYQKQAGDWIVYPWEVE